MKRIIVTTGLCMYALAGIACEACKKQQPKFLQGITHGAGPDSNWDYLIVAVMVLITVYTLYATIQCFIKPAESNALHIKRSILEN